MVLKYDVFIIVNGLGKGKTKMFKQPIYIYLECL